MVLPLLWTVDGSRHGAWHDGRWNDGVWHDGSRLWATIPTTQYQQPQYQQPQKPLEEKDAKETLENYIKNMRNPNLKLGKIKDAGNTFEAEIVTKDNSLVDKIVVDKMTGWMRSAY